ncbi:GntR family transcriptional regulator [Gordonia otitidis]|uniref:GntR family transcriptional regulator n=1 Tax=Gordonia otitidis TaxID=249058 RepID=UPI001D140C46|nr:GntR family transcriptional regulator [Gordonia otitidis]UEA58003.1 GntR family transcriptional regulator [Gordonia otitidis]
MATSPKPVQNKDISRIRSRRPLQSEIREAILGEYILSGRLRPGDKMPSETELCDIFGASRVTIRTAMQGLKDAGYIRIVRGSGSWVLPRPESIHSGLDRLVSFDLFASDSGKKIGSGEVEIVHLLAGEDACTEVFGAAVGFTKVSRTKLIDDRVVAFIVDYVPDEVVTTEEMRSAFRGSVLDVLLDRGLAAYSDCQITPVVADEQMSKRFGDEQLALLQLSELTRDESGTIVNRSESWLSPAAFTFQLRRRRDG